MTYISHGFQSISISITWLHPHYYIPRVIGIPATHSHFRGESWDSENLSLLPQTIKSRPEIDCDSQASALSAKPQSWCSLLFPISFLWIRELPDHCRVRSFLNFPEPGWDIYTHGLMSSLQPPYREAEHPYFKAKDLLRRTDWPKGQASHWWI